MLVVALAAVAVWQKPAWDEHQRQLAPGGLPLSLVWASTEYFANGPADPVVELRIIVDNTGKTTTESTTILWDPAFQQSFLFLRSEPAPWRLRTDERGWGVLDTSGTIPGRYGTFKMWFASRGRAVLEPRVVVVANGSYVVAETVATATHLHAEVLPPAQLTFERGPVAAAADAVRFLPADEHGALPLAAIMGLSLTAVVAAGSVVAYRQAGRGSA